METGLVEVKVKAVLPAMQGYGIFMATRQKTFVIYVEPALGEAIATALCKKKYKRPSTHDLIQSILLGFEVTIEHIIINDVDDMVFFARLFFKTQNKLNTKLIEIDTRPSDAIILALQKDRPIYVSCSVLDKVEDMTQDLDRIINETDT